MPMDKLEIAERPSAIRASEEEIFMCKLSLQKECLDAIDNIGLDRVVEMMVEDLQTGQPKLRGISK
jgi:ABC-type transport system involved in cytochrome c biogenesis ATPase subunit